MKWLCACGQVIHTNVKCWRCRLLDRMKYDVEHETEPPEFMRTRPSGLCELADWIRENRPEEISYHGRESVTDIAIRLLESTGSKGNGIESGWKSLPGDEDWGDTMKHTIPFYWNSKTNKWVEG